MDLLIKNGTIVCANERFRADVAVENGVISLLGESLSPTPDATVVDATGLLVLPGAIDAHTHMELDTSAVPSADSFFTGTRAAACGGTTTIIDYASQNKGESFPDTLKRRDALCSGSACVDYAFHIGVSDMSALPSLADCIRAGVTSYKAYMVYDFGLKDGEIYTLLEACAKEGALVAIHAENRDMVELLTRRFVDAGLTDAYHHYLSRPEAVEAEAVHRALCLARMADAPLYLVHQASAEGVAEIEHARALGQTVYAETCPQYLRFTNEVYRRANGRNFVCSPAIKGEASRKALWQAVRSGVIDTVATDHCPFQQADKDLGLHDFSKIPNGCAGVELMYSYLLSEASQGSIPFERAVSLCAANPAHIFGLAHRKGALTIGKDADMVLFDPSRERTIRNKELHGANDHTVWEGERLHGAIARTYSRGQLVYRDGVFVGQKGWGRYLPRRRVDTD